MQPRQETRPLTTRPPRANCPGILGRMPTKFLADVVDLGYGGVGLQSTELPRLRQSYRIDLGHPGLTFEGRVVWTRFVEAVPDGHGQVQPVYRCGLQFDDGDRCRGAIERFLVETGAQPLPGLRATPRYRFDDVVPRLMISSFPFSVVTLSRTGMLVVIEQLPEANVPLSLDLALPTGSLLLTGRVVDVFQNIDHGGLRTRVAFSFVDPCAEAIARLDAFVEAYARRGMVH